MTQLPHQESYSTSTAPPTLRDRLHRRAQHELWRATAGREVYGDSTKHTVHAQRAGCSSEVPGYAVRKAEGDGEWSVESAKGYERVKRRNLGSSR
jgi:hypothetical protein